MSFLTILRRFFPLLSVLFFSYLSLKQKKAQLLSMLPSLFRYFLIVASNTNQTLFAFLEVQKQ